MTTQSEQQVGGTLTDSMLHEIMGPGYLPDITALTSQMETGYEGPYLEILEQPKSRGFRFRYPCEGPSHGGLPGEFTNTKNKSYPSVQLCNYKGPCRIVVSLVTDDLPHMPHAHSLTGKNATKEGIVTVQIGPEQGMTASFPNLGIQHVTKKNVARILTERYTKMQALQTATLTHAMATSNNAAMSFLGVGNNHLLADSRGPFDRDLASTVAGEESKKIMKLVQEQAKSMNLSAVRLCFQAYLPDENGNFTKPLKSCISNPVYDSKAPNSCQLKICRMDKKSGCVTGGEEVYLLCDRVQREDIEVRFFELDKDHNKVLWEDLGSFAPSDVHRQFAIVFKTPAYYNIAIERPVDVFIELRRKSDKETSESFTFTYTPQVFDTEQIGAKRRKKVPHFAEYFPPGGPPGAAGGGSGGGSFGLSTGGFDFNTLFGLSAGTSTSTTTQQGNTSAGGTQNASSPDTIQPLVDKMNQLALTIAENCASAMRDFAATGDVRYLLSTQRQVTAVQNDDGDTALHLAVINCQFTAVEGLVSVMKGLQGDLIDMFNYLRQTPLHLATLTKRPLTVECLLRGNAKPTLQDRHGNTPVHTACAQGDIGCLKVLLDKTLRKECEEFAELHWQNYEGYTPLHLAVIKGNREIIKLLISLGANVEAKDGTCGRSPLHLAVEQNNLAIAGFLILEAKCDVDSYTYDDNTPLHLAAGLGLESQTALLVAAGADTMASNSEDETPYSLASNAEVKKILGDDEGPETDIMNQSNSEPVIKDMSTVVNTDISRFISPPETTTLLMSGNPGNTKNVQAMKDIMDREDSGVGGDSGFGSHSLESGEDSFSLPWSSHPDKIMRPYTVHEPRFSVDQSHPIGRGQ